MTIKFKITQKDLLELEAFYQSIKETTIPLRERNKRIILNQAKPNKKEIKTLKKETIYFSEELPATQVTTEELISYQQNTLSKTIGCQIKKKRPRIDAVLDLHGLSVAKAKEVLADFFQQCLIEKIEIALVIHGKGREGEMPILKNQLNCWLRHMDFVLGFCSAAPMHGGAGALYIFLKIITRI